MDYSDKIIDVTWNIDCNKLIEEGLELSGYEPFIDPLDGKKINGWMIKKNLIGYGKEIADSICKLLGVTDYKPRFYLQDPGVIIDFHKDRGTLCSLNYVLSDNPAAISFRCGDYHYKSALLNTQVDHAVINGGQRRLLYKISIFDKSYGEIKNVLPSTIQC